MEKQTEIIIKIKEREFKVNEDTPEFTDLLDYIIENKDKINLENELEVNCNEEKFDKVLFKNTIVETINELLELIKINNERLNELLVNLNNNDEER